MSRKREQSESGMLVYPKLPMPKRESEARMPKQPKRGGTSKLAILVLFVVALGAGGAAGYFARPMIDGEGDERAHAQAARETAVAAEQAKSAQLAREAKQLEADKQALTQQLADAVQVQSTTAGKAADVDKQAKDTKAAEQKLDAAVDKSAGTVTSEGAEIRISLVDKALFKANDDALTPGGKKLLDKLAAAIKELPEQQIAVAGHTDDQPPPPPVAPKPAPAKKGAKAVKAAPPPPVEPPVIRFATNWELSAARALAVVHHLQDAQKIPPGRLVALAYGQYRPVSKSNKAANRRVELVLSPKSKPQK